MSVPIYLYHVRQTESTFWADKICLSERQKKKKGSNQLKKKNGNFFTIISIL